MPTCAFKIFSEAPKEAKSVNTLPISLQIPPVYVTHYKKFPERLRHVMRQIVQHSTTVKVVSDFDREELNDEIIACFTSVSDRAVLTTGELSLILKHYWIYYDIVNHQMPWSLVLEDDAVLSTNFTNEMADTLSLLQSNDESYGMVFVGGCLGLTARGTPARVRGSTSLFRSNVSRCTHGYLVSLEGARCALQHLRFNDPIDIHINKYAKEIGTFWTEPAFITQDYGLVKTRIRAEKDE